MFGTANDHVPAFHRVCSCNSSDGEVQTLCGSGSENYFIRFGMEEFGDFAAGCFYCFCCYPTIGMGSAGGVAKLPGEVGKHGVKNLWVNRSGAVMVEVNGGHGAKMRNIPVGMTGVYWRDAEWMIFAYSRCQKWPENARFLIPEICTFAPYVNSHY